MKLLKLIHMMRSRGGVKRFSFQSVGGRVAEASTERGGGVQGSRRPPRSNEMYYCWDIASECVIKKSAIACIPSASCAVYPSCCNFSVWARGHMYEKRLKTDFIRNALISELRKNLNPSFDTKISKPVCHRVKISI